MELAELSQQAVLEADSQEMPNCRHYWMIERPNGPMSNGVCRLCGESRKFQNYVEGAPRRYEASLQQPSDAGRLRQGLDVSAPLKGSDDDDGWGLGQ